MPTPAITDLVPLCKQGLIDADLSCSGCGYNLRTQKPEANCPECGEPIAETLTHNNAVLMPVFWLGQVFRGSICLALSWPLILACGLGFAAWGLGAVTIAVEPPLNQLNVRKLQQFLFGAGVLSVVLFCAGFAIASESDSGTGLAMIGLGYACLVVHLMLVHRFAASICKAARLPGLATFGNVLAYTAGAAGIAMIGIGAVSKLLPIHLQFVLGVVPFGILAFIVADMVFWILLAVGIHTVRKKALALQGDAPTNTRL